MEYRIETFKDDKLYVAMKYDKTENEKYKDMDSFWSYFTEQLYNSEEADYLIDNNEAIGYMKCNDDLFEGTIYYVGCPIIDTKYINNKEYEKIIIPKG